MSVGLQIDLVGWFALALILAALYGLNSEKGERSGNIERGTNPPSGCCPRRCC